MVELETSVKELNNLGLLSIRALNVCRNGGIETLGQILSKDNAEFLKIRHCGRRTLEELTSIRDKFLTSTSDNSDAIVENIEVDSALNEAHIKIEHLPHTVYSQFENWLKWQYAKLSVRAKNAFPDLSDCSVVIRAIYADEKFIPVSVKNCGKKTSEEIISYLNNVRSHFEEITESIDLAAEIPQPDIREKRIVEMEQSYPFLLTRECASIIDFMQENGLFPVLFVAKKYILRTDVDRLDLYRDYYGLNTLLLRQSLYDISVSRNLTRERIRQIISQAAPLPTELQKITSQYLGPRIPDVIAFDSLLWNKIQRENMLEESYPQTALLVCALLDSHIIIQIDEQDKEYLVRKSIVQNVKIKNVLSNICRFIKQRHTSIEHLDILKYIKAEKRSYHKDVNKLCCIYSGFIKQKYDVVIEDERFISILPNSIDISIVLENILEQKGRPMSIDELLVQFNLLYPANAITSTNNLKPYIFKNPNILPKGKTGRYVLSQWKNHFTGTLTAYLEYLLRDFKEPMLLDDLVEFAIEEFPTTNKKSIYSLLVGDKDNRFVIYESDYIGLADSADQSLYLKERRIIRRHSFDSRFEDLKDFVCCHKRLPTQTGADEELSLARWMINILKSNIESTEQQRESLEHFLKENATLPQNGTEYNFKQMCDSIKVIVNRTFNLPDRNQDSSEYNWLHKNLEKYKSYKDNRRTYFEDLLSYLRDFGFFL